MREKKLVFVCVLLLKLITNLFSERIVRSKISVALAVNGGISTATNSIHLPVSVVIVYYMKITMPAPGMSKEFG